MLIRFNLPPPKDVAIRYLSVAPRARQTAAHRSPRIPPRAARHRRPSQAPAMGRSRRLPDPALKQWTSAIVVWLRGLATAGPRAIEDNQHFGSRP
jgi:hypothetical protein